jgi:hypothetical protein
MVKEFLGARPTVGTGRSGARERGSVGGVASGGGVGVGVGNGINEMENIGRLGGDYWDWRDVDYWERRLERLVWTLGGNKRLDGG